MAIAGELPPPPMAKLMDIRLTQIEKGKAIFTGTPQEFHYNPLGSVHGGYGATLLDSAMGCAVHSTLDPGDIYTTLEFKINFMRALTHETGEVRGIGTVINATRTTAVAEGRIEDASGKTLCVRDVDVRNTKGRTRVSESGPQYGYFFTYRCSLCGPTSAP